MSNRISYQDLKNLATVLNKKLDRPTEYAYLDEEGKYRSSVGHFHINAQNGGYELVETTSLGGGTRDVSTGGLIGKKELYYQIHGILKGIRYGKGEL